MIQPKTVSISCQDGSEKEFVISKIPALPGREIVTQYLPTAAPKIGNYSANEELLVKLMGYVAAIGSDDQQIRLSTRALIDNHVPDFEALMRLEAAMFEYNVSFFQNGRALTFFGSIEEKAKALISQTLTDFVGLSSAKGSPSTGNSKRNTRSKKR
jgi:hypothetical protein